MNYSETTLRFAQNFLINESTVRALVAQAPFSGEETVLEIGPGNGIITAALSHVVNEVKTIEIDESLIESLEDRFASLENIDLIEADFLTYSLPTSPYSVFSNIPFNITAEIMRKLLYADNPPVEGWFIMQKEAAEKFVGDYGSTESSVLYQNWFRFDIVTSINRFEFRPVPNVDTVLLHVIREPYVKLDQSYQELYALFVMFGFRSWKKNLKSGYKHIFTHEQWKRLGKANRFKPDALPHHLTVEQWRALFQYFLIGVSEEKREIIEKYIPR